MDVRNISVQFLLNNEEDCVDLIKKESHKLPLLNCLDLDDLYDQRLVRFRGMVQDMYNPEYYFEKYEVFDEITTESTIRGGKYLDTLTVKDKEVLNMEGDNNVTGQRYTYVLITEPALNKWTEEVEKKKNKVIVNQSQLSTSQSLKRELEGDEASGTSSQLPVPSQNGESSKKQCTSTSSQPSQAVVSKEHLLNFPIPGQAGKAIHLKLYNDTTDLKINDVVECVGFLSLNSALEINGEDEFEDQRMEIQTHNPPPSLIPRIHCVTYNKIDNFSHFIPEDQPQSLESIRFLRAELHTVLTQLLLGDTLAAEYLIYHLISRIYLRQDILPIGKFSLNISHIPTFVENYPKRLYDFIENLVPKSHYLPLSLENMNDLAFIPKKDYECNRLTSGLLQLSPNTHLVLDEMQLTAGKLNGSGVKATTAIKNVIKFQKLPCDFVYYNTEFDCDIPFIVLSEGKSFLPSDCHIVLHPDEAHVETFDEVVDAAKVYLKPELVDALRIYLMERRFAKYEITNDMQELIQKDYVELREKSKISSDDLHSWLVLARLICLAEGKTVLDSESWKKAIRLETERKARI